MPVLYKGHLCTVWCHTDVSSVMSYWCQQLCLYIWSYMLFVSKYGACEVRLSEIRRLSPYMEGCVGYLHIWRFNLQRFWHLVTNLSVDKRLLVYCNSPCPFMPIYGDLLTVSPCPFYAHIWIFLMSSVYEHIWAFWYAHIWRSLNCKPLSLLCPYIDIPDVIRICPYMGFLICPYMEISVSPYMGIKGYFRSDIRFVYIGLLGLTSQTPWAIWPRNLYLGIDDSSWPHHDFNRYKRTLSDIHSPQIKQSTSLPVNPFFDYFVQLD